ncbi:MAG: hypothetical protein OHK0032_00140 [Thermodesulfovibrionales bacterium]
MPINTLWGNIFKKRPVIDLLRETAIFSKLSSKDLSMIEEFLHPRTYHPDEVVFNEGDPGVGMYIVASGRVRITKKAADGSRIELATIDNGGFFGEISVIEGGPRTASAIAIEKTDLLGFFKSDLDELIDRRPVMAAKILYQIAKVLGERLRATNEELSRLSEYTKDVRASR